MKILKGYTKNPHCLEASIVERYIAEEAIEFCSEYMEKKIPIGVPKSWHNERVRGKGSRGLSVITPSLEELQQAHLYILNNSNEVMSYIVRHEALVKESNPKISKNRVLKEHNKTFVNGIPVSDSTTNKGSTEGPPTVADCTSSSNLQSFFG